MARRKSLIAKLLAPQKGNRKKKRTTPSKAPNNGWRYTSDVQSIQHVSLSSAEPFVVPSGPRTIHVYTYDGRPLKGTRKGSKFLLDVVRGQKTMTSVYTNTTWTEKHSVAYKGDLIGFMNGGVYSDLVEYLLGWYERVAVQATRLGTDPKGWPIIEITVPYKSWFEEEFGRNRKAPMDRQV